MFVVTHHWNSCILFFCFNFVTSLLEKLSATDILPQDLELTQINLTFFLNLYQNRYGIKILQIPCVIYFSTDDAYCFIVTSDTNNIFVI